MSAVFVFKEHELRLHTHYMHRKEESTCTGQESRTTHVQSGHSLFQRMLGCSTMMDVS